MRRAKGKYEPRLASIATILPGERQSTETSPWARSIGGEEGELLDGKKRQVADESQLQTSENSTPHR